MKASWSLAAVLLLLAACASPVRTSELPRIDQNAGYRYAVLDQSSFMGRGRVVARG